MITLPESVAFYWREPINMAAINVIAPGMDVPSDLTLEEAERYELASLAARRVRVDFWRLLRTLWSATWGEAVRGGLPAARLLTYGEHRAFADEIEIWANPSIEHAWGRRATCGVYDVRGHGRLFTSLGLTERDREIELKFYLYDADGSCGITDDLDLGPDWSDDGESRRVTSPGLVPITGRDLAINPVQTTALAQAAVASLSTALRQSAL